MTAAVPNEGRPLPTWLAHHHVKLGVAGLTGYALVAILPTEHWTFAAGLALGLPAALAFLGFIEGMRYAILHTGLTCDYCMDRITVNGQEEAQRRKRALRLMHRWSLPVESLAALLSFLVLPIVTLLTGLWWLAIPALAPLPWMVWTAYLLRVHSRLQPWCPDCRNGGWGPREVSPDPLPLPEGVAS